MKQKRFTEEQIIAVLYEHEAGVIWPASARSFVGADRKMVRYRTPGNTDVRLLIYRISVPL